MSVATADAATYSAGLLDLLTLVWMELCMAGLAALVYIMFSGRIAAVKGVSKAKTFGHAKRRGGFPKSPAAWQDPGDSTKARNSNLARQDSVSTTDSDGKAALWRTGSNKKLTSRCDESSSDTDRCTPTSPWPVTSKEAGVDAAAQARGIRACGKNGDLDGAVATYERSRRAGCGANSLIFNTLLDACIVCGALEKAEEYFEQAKSRNHITVVSYNTMMKGYLAQNRVKEAEGLLQEIAARGLTATQASYHGLLQSRLQSGDRRGAWQMVETMQEHNIAPNAVTCAIMLKGVMSTSSGEVCYVLKMVKSMTSPIDEVLFSAVVEACLGIERLDYLSSIRAMYAKQGGHCCISVALYGTMIKAYGKARDLSIVWELWEHMETQKVKLTSITVGCMVEALVANRRPEDAWDLVQALWNSPGKREVLNTVIYSTIIKGFVNTKQPDKVMIIYDEMRSREIRPNAITYNTILNAFAQCKAIHRAPQLLQEMYDAQPRVEPDIVTYSTIVKGYCANGDLDTALELFKTMKADAKLKPDEVTYNSLLDGCAKQNRPEAALQLVEDMKEANVPASNFTLSILVKLLGKRKQLNQAFDSVDTISSQYGFKVNIQVYTCLIQACFNNRQPDRAVALHERMLKEGLSLDEKGYTALLRGCLQAGATDKAVHIVRCAYGIVDRNAAAPGVDQRNLGELMEALGPNTEIASRLASEISTVLRRNAGQGRFQRSEAGSRAPIRHGRGQ